METTDRKLPSAKGAVDLLSMSFRSVKKSEKEIRKNVGSGMEKAIELFSKVLKILKLGKTRQSKTRVQNIEHLLSEYASLGDKYGEIKYESLSKDEKIKTLAVIVRNLKKRLKEKEIEDLKRVLMANG